MTFKKGLQSIINIFEKHPQSIGESYLEHLMFAMFAGIKLVLAGVACMLHSIFPFIFINTASSTIHNLTENMKNRKNKTIGSMDNSLG